MERPEIELAYDRHAACAFAIFRRFTKCDVEAQDLLQDWLIKIANQVHTLAGLENERAFLLRIAYRQAVDWSRRSASHRRTLQTAIENEAAQRLEFRKGPDPDRKFLKCKLASSLSSLPEDQQTVVQLKLWDHLTFAEIGEITGTSANTAASRYRYGIGKLQSLLQPVYEEFTS